MPLVSRPHPNHAAVVEFRYPAAARTDLDHVHDGNPNRHAAALLEFVDARHLQLLLVADREHVRGSIGEVVQADRAQNFHRALRTQVVIFGILIGVLVLRPTGLLGMRVPEK